MARRNKKFSNLPLRNFLPPTAVKIIEGQYNSLAEQIWHSIPKTAGISLEQVINALAEQNIVDRTGIALINIVDEHRQDFRLQTGRLGLDKVYIYREIPDSISGQPLSVVANLPGAVVINKPHGMASMPRGDFIARSAVVQARYQWQNPDIIPAHRLDRLTAGLILLVTERTARGRWQKLFQQGKVTKFYRAICEVAEHTRIPDNKWHELANRLERKNGQLATQVVRGTVNAVTRYRLLESWQTAGKQYAYFELQPLTGKTHQLRAHLAVLGFPIIGDPIYPQVLPATHPYWMNDVYNFTGLEAELPTGRFIPAMPDMTQSNNNNVTNGVEPTIAQVNSYNCLQIFAYKLILPGEEIISLPHVRYDE